MAEGGEDYSFDNKFEPDDFLLDSDSEALSDEDEESDDAPVSEDEGDTDEDEEISLEELERTLSDDEELQEQMDGDEQTEGNIPVPHNIRKILCFVNFFYGHKVRPTYLNILTDFADAEIFLIDGDSLLLELLEETTLDWTNGGQFLHLTYLVESFLQYFTDKGGVFHVVFFKDMENMWGSQPSMLLARQALILHLQYNTPFTVVSSIDNCWGKQWKDYVDDKCPAFLLLTDAESIPWEATSNEQKAVEFFFRSLLCHSLGQELNCVFMSGIEMTATKVMGFYTQSSSDQKYLFRKFEKQVHEIWQFLVRLCQQEAPLDVFEFPIDLKEKVQTALRSPPKGGCRELATVLACGKVLSKLLDSCETSTETVKPKEDIIKLFLLHSILLKKLPLKYRSHSINSELLDQSCKTDDGEGFPFREFHINLWKILKLIQEENDGEETSLMATGNALDMKSVADMMDGRLVHSLFLAVLEQGTLGLRANSLPEDVIEEAETAWSKVVSAANSDALKPQFFPLLAFDATKICGSPEGGPGTNVGTVTLRRLLDVDNGLVNEYAGEIRTRLNAMADDSTTEDFFVNGREFDERYHWHTRKLLSDDYDRTRETIKEKPPDNERQRFFFYRNKQMYVRFLRMYGNSLLGGSGKEKVIIVKEDGADKKKGKDKTNKVGKKGKQYQEENKQRRRDEEKKKEQERWNIVRKAAEPYLDKGDYIPSLESIDAFLTNSEFPQVRHPALMMKAKCCFGAWQDKRYGDPTANDMKYPVLLMETVQRITQEDRSEEAGKLLTDKEKKKLSGYMMKLGFEEIAETFAQLTPGRKERPGGKFSVHQTSARFQLDHMGHLLKRDDRSDPDTRVDGFIPDTWQRKLLDAVDNKESALIVAPTSSGKTYASYYCMEKVLEESNEGVVVYVSPTKALVNQVAATIYARFRKNQLPEGRSVYGIFTRDYRHNTLNSQILVTVPQCLEILFLSPRRQDWTRNVRYVIFDEVHCLGQEIGAEVWEHLLLLIRCPFLALSATIGNPDDLLRWLQAAQDFREQQDKQDNGRLRKSYKVRLVTCDERYSDLEKSIYLPRPSNGAFSVDTREYESSYDVTRTDEFIRLHPCAQLATKQLMENGFPGDMALTPKEALQLYDVMAQHWPGKESLKSLSPEEYFKEQSFIPKSCARQYEKELKKEFKSWADDRKKTKVEAVIRSLNSVFLKRKESADEEWSQVGMPSSGYNFVEKNFPKLVEQLKAQGKLPALVFSFDRVMCEKMATGLVRKFEEREEHLQEKDDAQRAKLAKDKKQREKAQKILKRQRDLLEKIKKGDRYHPVLEQVTIQEVKGKDSVVLNEPLPECTVAFTYGIGNEDLKKIIARIETSRGKLNKKRARTFRKQAMNFKALLRRGISYHHAGLDNKKRSCVEMLFRERYLQVVTATGTLALGIHMPCKTVVLAGDSPFLNSLQYRQMSGRAGRRGFDPVGNVVFFGIPYRKVQRLITANIPWLVGNFPINVSLVLRLLLMTSKGDNKKDALTKALALLSHPFICQKHPKMENQIKKHFLFSVELLARLGLINIDNGAPQEMAGLATHLHYHEPANLVLVSFLQRGLFHKLCKRQRNDLSPRTGRFSEDVMRTMVLILNHLFARRYLHANFKRRLSTCPSSKVILEDLPDDFAEALQEYNDQVTGVFSQYLTTVAAELENDQGEENKLPLSGIEFPRLASLGETDEDYLIQKLGMSSMSFSACSSFAALSGNSDLKLSSLGKTPASAGQGLSSAVEVGLKKDDVSKGGKKNKKKKRRGKQTISTGEGSKTGSEENENDSMADRQQPIDYLLKIVRQDVYTDMNVVPTLPVRTYDSAGRLRHLNAYALDFYKHGSKAAIVKENGVKAGEVFNVLKDFCFTVKSISCSLEEWGPANDNVVLAFKQLAQEFEAKFRNQFNAEI